MLYEEILVRAENLCINNRSISVKIQVLSYDMVIDRDRRRAGCIPKHRLEYVIWADPERRDKEVFLGALEGWSDSQY